MTGLQEEPEEGQSALQESRGRGGGRRSRGKRGRGLRSRVLDMMTAITILSVVLSFTISWCTSDIKSVVT